MNNTINISAETISLAKEQTKEFDKIKTYDKFKCNTNYRGLLGEMILNSKFKEEGIEIEWVTFNKSGWNEPDFVKEGFDLDNVVLWSADLIKNKREGIKTTIKNKLGIDLKTSVADVMYFNKVQHDIYIYAQISPDDKEITFKGWLPKNMLIRAKTDGNARYMKDNFGRMVYTISADRMYSMDSLYAKLC